MGPRNAAQGPHEVGTAAFLSGRGGRVVAGAATPDGGQGRRATPKATRALTAVVPGGQRPQGPHEVGTAPLLRRRGGVLWITTAPESCQGQRAKRALTRFVPGGQRPPRAPRSGDGRFPQRPWGACCGRRRNTRRRSRPKSDAQGDACLDGRRSGGAAPPGPPRSGDGASPQAPWGRAVDHHSTRILSRPKSEACLDEIRSGGAAPPQGPTKWGRPLSSAAVGGVLWHAPQHPTAVKAEERRRRRRVP